MAHTPSSPSGPLRTFLVFAIGLVAGIGLTVALGGGRSGGSTPEDGALGTFLPRDSIERLELVDRETLDAGALRGVVETRAGRGIVIMEVAVEAGTEGEITVEFDEAALSPRGFNQEDATAGEIRFKKNEFQLLNSGTNRYQLTFRKRQETETPLRVRISGEGGDEVIQVDVAPKP